MFRKIPIGFFFCLSFFALFAVSSQWTAWGEDSINAAPDVASGTGSLEDHYRSGLRFYHQRDYNKAAQELHQVAAIDSGYKKTAKYLAKAEKKLQDSQQETNDAPQAESQVNSQLAVPEELQREPVYKINIGDIVDISVWRNADLQRQVIVRPDGLISFPLVGEIPAVGLTLVELDAVLTKKLAAFVRSPEVSVAISRFGGTKVIILGEVRGPGVYSPTGKGTVLEVLALAGGFTNDAVKNSVILIRGGLVSPKPVRLNLARALAYADLRQNAVLAPNDIIYVPKKFVANVNYWVQQFTPTLSNMLLGTNIHRDLSQ